MRRAAPAGSSWGSADLASSFDLRAAEYARLRPDYPAASVDAAVPEHGVRVLDLAAGTGKLTGALIGRGHRVLAVEPLPGMLAELHRRHPAADAVAGNAEQLPVAAGSVDAVTVAQAFHWFDQRRALDGMARVLRPGGTVALVWNHDDERDPMVADVEAALDRIGRPAGGSTGRGRSAGRTGTPGPANGEPPRRPPFVDHPDLTDPELVEIAWRRPMSVDDFIALQHTYSYVIRASDGLRARLDVELRTIIRAHVGDAGSVTVPVTCQVWRSVRR